MTREYFRDIIFQNSIRNPDKDLLKDDNERSFSYRDCIHTLDNFTIFAKTHSFLETTLIAVASQHSIHTFPLSLAVLENCVLYPYDFAFAVQHGIEELIKIGVQYVVFDGENHVLVDNLKLNNIGVIMFDAQTQSFEMISNSSVANSLVELNKQRLHNMAYLHKTSGTTHHPKLIPVSYNQLIHTQKVNIELFSYHPQTVQLHISKKSRLFGIYDALRIAQTNGTFLICNDINYRKIYQFFVSYSISIMYVPPVILFSLFDFFKMNNFKINFNHKTIVVVSGASISQTRKLAIENEWNVRIIINYGTSETGLISTDLNAPYGYRPNSVGIPIVDISFLNGEILVKGEGVIRNYFDQKESNAFIDGWYRTGDLGRIDDDGYLYIIGRIKELINIGGEKVSPNEIETLLSKHNNIQEVVVFPIKMEDHIEQVACAVVTKNSERLSLKELRSFLVKDIEPFKLPTILFHTNHIPKDDTSKIQRHLLLNQMTVLYEESLK
jgi:acyl-CoA synthetase (AMP-forming)/AMP-acid ligase II